MAALDVRWRETWTDRDPEAVSWFEPVPQRSLELIADSGVAREDPIVDVGGGASRLVDDLLAAGYRDLSVLDIADEPLALARRRLGDQAAHVAWIVADVRAWEPPRRYALWHDRAVLHFLVDPDDRDRYVQRVRTALAPGGAAVIATFAPDGPVQCSGMPVQRYDAEQLESLLGGGFTLVYHHYDTHRTPSGADQRFVYVLLRRDE